ncbi:MAG: hypothetical protein ACYC67_08210 [Prosthecobacter sp.]|jgi:hypothetical protein
MTSTPISTCYWCGKAATSNDHVPPQSFFPQGKNLNLFKVPSCANHNEMFSTLDERFRFYIQGSAMSEDAFNMFADKTIRGLQREAAKKFTASLAQYSKWVTVAGERRRVFSVEPEKQNQFFEKLVRGAYYLAFREPACGQIVTASPQFYSPGLDYKTLAENLGLLLNDGSIMTEYACPNPDIFRFRFGREGTPPKQAAAIVMLFYGSVEILGLVTPLLTSQ